MKENSNKFYEISLAITLALLVLFPKMTPIGIILLGISVIILGIKRELASFKTIVHLFFFLFYLVFVFGLFFTRNPDEAHHVLESKLSFIIFPLLFFFIPKKKIDYSIAGSFYVLALLGRFFYDLIKSISAFEVDSSLEDLFSSQFSTFIHPTYMSMYYLMGIFFLINPLKYRLVRFPNYLKIIFGVILLSGYVLCMSLSAYLFLFLLVAVYGWILLYRRIGVIKSLVLVLVTLSSLIYFVQYSKDTMYDLDLTTRTVRVYIKSPQNFLNNADRYLVGNEVRLVMWTVSYNCIKQQPMGYGTGNIDLVLGKKLRTHGLNDLAKHNYNSHNQYLQTGVEVGLIGLVILLGMLFAVFGYALKQKNTALIVLVCCVAFNSLFESVFQRETGIIFFCIMTFFLMCSRLSQTGDELKR